MNSLVKTAMLFAREKHKEQKYGNKDYFLYHVCSVADSLDNSLTGMYHYNTHKDEILITAYLHDVVEDTNTTIEEIEHVFGSSIAKYVYLLTKQQNETRVEYLSRVCESPIATLVKLHDSTCNATQSLSDGDLQRFSKYMQYIGILGKNIEKLTK